MRQLSAFAAALAMCAPLVAQTAPTSRPGASGQPPREGAASPAREPGAPARITATGCLQRAEDGRFLLTRVETSPGTVDSGLTSPSAGTSATGDAPSGSVTGRTPTGSTADVTPAPVPEAGTPGETASPASPTFRRPAAAGTSGSVAGSDTAGREYRLLPGAGVDLAAHIGHTVEVSGAVQATAPQPSGTARAGEKTGSRGQSAAESAGISGAPRVVQAVTVERLRHVLATCEQ